MFNKVRFVSGITILYAVGIGGVVLLASQSAPSPPVVRAEPNKVVAEQHATDMPRPALVAGKPIRLVLPSVAIDIPIDEGYYNETTNDWTLSETRGQFAMMTVLANNTSGNTLLYGHGTDAVFGNLNTALLQPDTKAIVYTDNGHILSYRFEHTRSTTPEDTATLYVTDGPSTLTIQTCTGMYSEWRTLYQFAFEEVIKQ